MQLNNWVILGISCLILSTANAQQKPQEPTQPGTRKETSRPQQSQADQKQETSLFLTGTVMLEDGTPLVKPIPVELLCGGRVIQQIDLTTQGRFTFTVGNNSSARNLMDASVSGGRTADGSNASPFDSVLASGNRMTPNQLGRVDLGGCEVRLSPRAGLVANNILLTSRGVLENPDIGYIVVRSVNRSVATTVSLKELTIPEDALEAFEKARQELSGTDADYNKAEKHLENAVKYHPGYSMAWHLLGRTRQVQGNPNARDAYENAIRSDKLNTGPYLDLVQIELQNQQWFPASELMDTLLEVSPDHPKAHYFRGLAKFNLNEYSTAEESFRFVEQQGLCQEYPMSYFYLGIIDSSQGEIPMAADEFRLFLDTMPANMIPPQLKAQLTNQLEAWREKGMIQ